MCNGEIAFGEEKQNSYTSKIFITYTGDSGNATKRGKKYEWVNVPNYRLCGLSLTEISKNNHKTNKNKDNKKNIKRVNRAYRDLSTFYCSAPRENQRNRDRTRNQRRRDEDAQLQRAIAASLGKEYVGNQEKTRDSAERRNNYDYDNGEDLQRAIAASLGQTYVAGQKFGTNDSEQDRDWNMSSFGPLKKEMQVDTNDDGTDQNQNKDEMRMS